MKEETARQAAHLVKMIDLCKESNKQIVGKKIELADLKTDRMVQEFLKCDMPDSEYWGLKHNSKEERSECIRLAILSHFSQVEAENAWQTEQYEKELKKLK